MITVRADGRLEQRGLRSNWLVSEVDDHVIAPAAAQLHFWRLGKLVTMLPAFTQATYAPCDRHELYRVWIECGK